MSAGRILAVVAALSLFVASPRDARAQSAAHAHAAHASTPAHAPTHTATHAASASATVSTAAEGTVNINTATEEELVRLPGIGPSRAAAIVALRQRVQRFRSPDDLVRVRGIGRASMRRLRPYVTLTGDTTLASRPGHAPRPTPATETSDADNAGGTQPTQ